MTEFNRDFNREYKTIENYERQKHLNFYLDLKYPFYCLTVHLDIAHLKKYVKEKKYSLYVNLCYLFTKAVNELNAFRVRLLDEKVVEYEQIHTRMIVPMENGIYTIARIPYHQDIHIFNKTAQSIIDDAKKVLDLSEPSEHQNVLYFSVLPDIEFTGLTHVPSDDASDTVPKITFGKFSMQNNTLKIPIGIQVNHVLIDGIHISALLQKVEKLFLDPK